MSDHFDEKAATWDDDPTRVARAADIAGQILATVRPGPDADVLDFGSGTGLLGFQLLPHVASVTFADTSQGMLRQVADKLRAGPGANQPGANQPGPSRLGSNQREADQPGRGRTLLLGSEGSALPRHYDLIVSLMTLHHVADPFATLGLLADHLSPGGWLAVCDLDTEDGTFHDDPDADVHHGFERNALISALEAHGLCDVQATTAYVMHNETAGGTRDYPLFLLTGRKQA